MAVVRIFKNSNFRLLVRFGFGFGVGPIHFSLITKTIFLTNYSPLCDILRNTANCATCRKMNRRWVCTDVWMDTLPFFGRLQLGLKLALISARFNSLVDKHVDGKSELTLQRPITIRKDIFAEVPKLRVLIGANSVEFPLSDRPLPNRIRFEDLRINYIDGSVLAFLHANKQIWNSGTNLRFYVGHYKNNNNKDIVQPIWNAFVREIFPIFAPNIRHLNVHYSDQLHDLLRISPTILSDLNINSINSGWLMPNLNGAFDEPNATARKVLNEWLHTPTTDGQPKRLFCCVYASRTMEWVNDFIEQFLCATTSVSYKIQFKTLAKMEPFEWVNEMTNEKLTMTAKDGSVCQWLMKRCQIGGTAAIQWEDENLDDLNTVIFSISDLQSCIVPLSPPPPPAAEEEEAGQSSEKEASSDNE